MSEWLPIETAPDDGVPVLVGWSKGNWHALVAHCEDDEWGTLEADMSFHVLQNQPTHWMPLPEPPTAT